MDIVEQLAQNRFLISNSYCFLFSQSNTSFSALFAYLLSRILFCLCYCFLVACPVFPLSFKCSDRMNPNVLLSVFIQKPSQVYVQWIIGWDRYFRNFLTGKTRSARNGSLYLLFMDLWNSLSELAKHKLWCLQFQKELPLSVQFSYLNKLLNTLCCFSYSFLNQILWGTPICKKYLSRV